MIKLVAVDMDGIIADLVEAHKLALNQALKYNGSDPITDKEHFTTFNGLPTRVKLAKLVELGRIKEEDIEFIVDQKQKLTLDMIMRLITPNGYQIIMFEQLKKDGYKLALCSNSIRQTVEAVLEATQLTKYFDVVLSNEDVVKAKPDPEMYLKAMELLGVTPEETLIVEDSPHGINAAHASGAHVLECPMGMVQTILVLDRIHKIK